jgi:hypothetical protein
LHFGLAYQLQDRFLFTLDLKNITAFKNKYFGEVHIGFEQNIIGNVFLREGLFFWENSISKTVSGLGLGYKTHLFKSVKEDNLDISLGGLFSCPIRQENNKISYRSDASVTLRYSF